MEEEKLLDLLKQIKRASIKMTQKPGAANGVSSVGTEDPGAVCNHHQGRIHLVDGTVYTVCVTADLLKEIRKLEVRPDDIWIATYPKSGTKWCAAIVAHLLGFRDGPELQRSPLALGFPLEYNFPLFEPLRDLSDPRLNHRAIAEWDSPRVLTTHLRANRLPRQIFTKKPKVIYVLRNPKAALVSFYNYSLPSDDESTVIPRIKSWEAIHDQYLEGPVPGGPWIEHVQGFLKHRGDPNFLFLTYEKMIQDPEMAVRRIADFLGVDCSDDKVRLVVEATSFETMKKQAAGTPLANHFRKGEVDDWKNYFTVAESRAFDAKITKVLENTDIKF